MRLKNSALTYGVLVGAVSGYPAFTATTPARSNEGRQLRKINDERAQPISTRTRWGPSSASDGEGQGRELTAKINDERARPISTRTRCGLSSASDGEGQGREIIAKINDERARPISTRTKCGLSSASDGEGQALSRGRQTKHTQTLDARSPLFSGWLTVVRHTRAKNGEYVPLPIQAPPGKLLVGKKRTTFTKHVEGAILGDSGRPDSEQPESSYPQGYPAPESTLSGNMESWDMMIGGKLSDPEILAEQNQRLENALPTIMANFIGHDGQISDVLRESGVKDFLPRLVKIFLRRCGIDFKNRGLIDNPPFAWHWLHEFAGSIRNLSVEGSRPIDVANIHQEVKDKLYYYFLETLSSFSLRELMYWPEFEKKQNILLGKQLKENKKFIGGIKSFYKDATPGQLKILQEALVDINSGLKEIVQISDEYLLINPVSLVELDYLLRQLFFLYKGTMNLHPEKASIIEDSSGLGILKLKSWRVNKFLELVRNTPRLLMKDMDVEYAASLLAVLRDCILLRYMSNTLTKEAPEGRTTSLLSPDELDELIMDLKELKFGILYSHDLSDYEKSWLGLPKTGFPSQGDGWWSDQSSLISETTIAEDVKYPLRRFRDCSDFHHQLLSDLEEII